MNPAPQPTARRVLSLLWFPFFFAAAFSLLTLTSFHHPQPHDVRVAVVSSEGVEHHLATALEHVQPGGFDVVPTDTAAQAISQVEHGDSAAAVAGSHVYVASAGSATRATYLKTVLSKLGGPQTQVTDVRPNQPGDVSGVSVLFFAMPMLLIGLITVIVTAQFGMWPMRKRLITVAVTGAFTTVFSYSLARGLDVLPADGWLLFYGFLLTQVIGWLSLAAAVYTKQFFMPVAMTFVLILGVPSSGGSVNGDMLPSPVAWFNSFMPFAQLIDIVRASAYFGNNGLARPLSILVGWALLGAALIGWHIRRTAIAHRGAHARLEGAGSVARHEGHAGLHGLVRTTSDVPVEAASITVLDESGVEVERTVTGIDGRYVVSGLSAGLHHVLVTARHCEPDVATIAIGASSRAADCDFVVQDWHDPALNLTAEQLGQRWDLSRR